MAITLSRVTTLSRTSVGGEYPAQAFTWAFDTGTAIAFSQANTVRFDQTVVTSVTQIGISNVDATGTDRQATILSWHNQANSAGTSYLTVGSTVFLINSANFVTWNYRFIGSYHSGSTTLPSQGQVVAISFSLSAP